MDDHKITTGVIKKDRKNLFTSKIETELQEIKNELDRLDCEIQKYEQLTEVLSRLPQELGWSIPYLPLTRHALLPNATLTNTNEVQVHIGDGWFTRCSAHHATGICRRRQEKCQSTKQKLMQREELLQEWLRVAQGQVGIAGGFQSQDNDDDDDLVTPSDAFNENELEEFITEEQYIADKIEHEQRAREHYLRQRAAIKLQEEMFARTTDDEEEEVDLMSRLDELEMQEDSGGELKAETPPAVVTKERTKPEPIETRASETASSSGASASTSSSELSESTIKLGWSWDDGSGSESSSENSETSQTEKKAPPRKLSFADHIKTGSDETSVIEFTHTPTESLPTVNTTGTLLSPSDIYANFQQVFAAANTPPKSILKRRSREEDQTSEFPVLQYPPKETMFETEYQQMVLGDIIERRIEEPSLPETSERQENISMFKAARLAAKQKHSK